MSNQILTSTLLVDLLAEEQQFIAGGFGYFRYRRYGRYGRYDGGKCEESDTDKSSGCDCGGATMYVGYKITVTPFYKCVGGGTGGCS
ncbi:hypothetical protein VB735_09545 [Halotia wernerae UHCC 0503]|nr:hypothetical protein [Halotia wernerae UHCC 0503]